MDVRRAVAVSLSLLAMLAAGCGGGGDRRAEPPPAPSTEPTPIPRPFLVDPGPRLVGFVEAAGRGDPERMWRHLATATRRRLGPTLDDFRGGPAADLEEGVGSFARSRLRVILAEPISSEFAVAAIAGERTAEGMKEFETYAAALRFERGDWRLLLGGPVRIEIVRPDPGESVRRRTQIAADAAADAPISEAGLWFDGVAFSSKGGWTDPMHVGMWGEATQPLTKGNHTVVAFASAGRNAAAAAWTFSVSVAGTGYDPPYVLGN